MKCYTSNRYRTNRVSWWYVLPLQTFLTRLSTLTHTFRATPCPDWCLMLTLKPQLDDRHIDHVWPASAFNEVSTSAQGLQLCTNEKMTKMCSFSFSAWYVHDACRCMCVLHPVLWHSLVSCEKLKQQLRFLTDHSFRWFSAATWCCGIFFCWVIYRE